LEFTLFASLLGGVGAAEIAAGNVRLRSLLAIIVAVGAALVVTAVAVMSSGRLSAGANLPLRNPAFFVPVWTFVAASVVIVLFGRAPRAPVMAVLLAICTLADVSTFAWYQSWRSPVTPAMLEPSPAAISVRARLAAGHQRVFSVAGGMTLAGVPPNLNLVWGLPAAGGYVQMLLTAPGIFLQLLPQGTISAALLANGNDQSLDLAAIRYIVAPAASARGIVAQRPGWKLVEPDARGDAIIENTRAQPRVRIVHRVIARAADATLDMIRQGLLDPREAAIPPGDGTLDTPSDGADSAVITDLDADDMRVNVACRNACFLATSDNYNSMWVATIDGTGVPLRLTDYTLRGVFVPPGKHVVAFAYRPWSIALGGAVTVLSLIAMLALVVAPSISARASWNGSDPAAEPGG
jgi:hypothetical protein